jgi:tetratricopeptide (TPR) repeat protein
VDIKPAQVHQPYLSKANRTQMQQHIHLANQYAAAMAASKALEAKPVLHPKNNAYSHPQLVPMEAKAVPVVFESNSSSNRKAQPQQVYEAKPLMHLPHGKPVNRTWSQSNSKPDVEVIEGSTTHNKQHSPQELDLKSLLSIRSTRYEWDIGSQKLDVVDQMKRTGFALCKKGIAFCELGLYRESVRCFTESIHNDPDFAPYYWSRASALILMHDFEGAMLDCHVALSLEPGRAESFTVRGLVFSSKGNHVKALEDYSEALRIDPRQHEARLGRAVAFLRRIELGDRDTRAFEFAREAFNDLAFCLLQQGMYRDVAVKVRLRFYHLLSVFDNSAVANGEAILTSQRKRICPISRLHHIAAVPLAEIERELIKEESRVYEFSRAGMTLDVITQIAGIKMLEGNRGLELMHKLKTTLLLPPQGEKGHQWLSGNGLEKTSPFIDPDLVDFTSLPRGGSAFFVQDFGLPDETWESSLTLLQQQSRQPVKGLAHYNDYLQKNCRASPSQADLLARGWALYGPSVADNLAQMLIEPSWGELARSMGVSQLNRSGVASQMNGHSPDVEVVSHIESANSQLYKRKLGHPATDQQQYTRKRTRLN